MTQRDWHRLFTDEELEAYGRLADDWEIAWKGMNQWVRYNSDGSYTFSYTPFKKEEKVSEQELKLGDTKPLDDFLETFAIKE